MALEEYKKKRKFGKTPEPKPKKKFSKGKSIFVIQKHDATRLHYDFRLEVQGVLPSWAVPKGPSLNPEDKHLAIKTEDHPYDYKDFEGVIPEGEYGAGPVMIWDYGTYHSLHSKNKKESEEEIAEGIKKGHVVFIVKGEKLNGEFAFIRFKKGGDNAWLLIKKRDKHASERDVLKEDKSAKTGRSLEKIYSSSVARSNSDAKSSHVRSNNKFVKPMLATLVLKPFDKKGWIFEIKFDGYRIISQNGRLFSRHGEDYTDKFSKIADELKKVKHDVVIDGEIVVLDKKGRSSFSLLQEFLKNGKGTPVYYVFDLLELDGEDLKNKPLFERKKKLKSILVKSDFTKFSDHVEEKGLKFFELASKEGLEGVMAKDSQSKYEAGERTRSWLKVKTKQLTTAYICGFTAPRGSRGEFGALILCIKTNSGFKFIGHVGGGFTQKGLSDMKKKLKPLITKKSPFEKNPKTNTPVIWVRPKFKAEIEFAEWTNDGYLRQPIFKNIVRGL